MPTASEMITRALRRIGVVASDEPATADQLASGLQSLNEIGWSFRLHGVMFDWPTIGAATEIPVGAACVGPLQQILAARLAEEYGVAGPAAEMAWPQLAAYYYVVPESDVRDLTRTSSQHRQISGETLAT